MLNHHTAAACSPTRAMLLTGTDAHLGGLGVLIEYKYSEQGSRRWSGKAGYEGYLNNDVATLPNILEDHGYFTVMSGKVSSLPCSVIPPSSRTAAVCTSNHLHREADQSIVASRAAHQPGTVGTWLQKGICHASRLLQSLRLGATAGAVPRRWSTSSCRGWEES